MKIELDQKEVRREAEISEIRIFENPRRVLVIYKHTSFNVLEDGSEELRGTSNNTNIELTAEQLDSIKKIIDDLSNATLQMHP